MLKLNPLNYPICFSQLLKIDNVSTWVEHTPFGMFMVDILRPRVIVELGTNRGCSYLAFCQTVKQLGLDTRCYAIDTWQGDAHTGPYSEDILKNLRAYHDPLYGDFSRLMQSTFDDALQHFSDDSIDLLHIDGFHTYEAVRHDFETWLPKLSKHAIVFFHDTNVHERDFGVWQFWAELQQKYPTFEFFHGYGLGVLRMEPDPASALDALFALDEAEAGQLRTFFSALGAHIATVAQREKRIAEKDQRIKALTDQQSEKDKRIKNLQAQAEKKEQRIQTLATQYEIAIKENTQIKTELHEIAASKAWRLALLLRSIRTFFIPVNSWQEKFARSFYRTVTGKK